MATGPVDIVLEMVMTSEELELAIDLACQELERAFGLETAGDLAMWEADGHLVCGLLADMAEALNSLRAESAAIGASIAAEVFPDPADATKYAALAAFVEQVIGTSVGINPFADFVSVAAAASCPHPHDHPGLLEVCDVAVQRSAIRELTPRGIRFVAAMERQQELADRPKRHPAEQEPTPSVENAPTQTVWTGLPTPDDVLHNEPDVPLIDDVPHEEPGLPPIDDILREEPGLPLIDDVLHEEPALPLTDDILREEPGPRLTEDTPSRLWDRRPAPKPVDGPSIDL